MKKTMLFLVTYEINQLPFNTLVLADSQDEAEELAREGVKSEAGRSTWKILTVEEVDLGAEHCLEY